MKKVLWELAQESCLCEWDVTCNQMEKFIKNICFSLRKTMHTFYYYG